MLKGIIAGFVGLDLLIFFMRADRIASTALYPLSFASLDFWAVFSTSSK